MNEHLRLVQILSGPSGCGKSNHARTLAANCKASETRFTWCSADHYFIDKETGEYVFDPTKLPIAHSDCMNKFIHALTGEGSNIVVVDNTNINVWEWQNYYAIAKYRGYTIEYHCWPVRTFDQAAICANRNTHGVPTGVILKMASEYNESLNTVRQYIGDDSLDIIVHEV